MRTSEEMASQMKP